MVELQKIIDLVAGDTGRTYFRFLGLDLTTYTVIGLHVKRQDGTTFTKEVEPEGASAPERGYVTWQAGDLTPGRHEAEVEFNPGADAHETLPKRYPMILNVRPELGSAAPTP